LPETHGDRVAEFEHGGWLPAETVVRGARSPDDGRVSETALESTNTEDGCPETAVVDVNIEVLCFVAIALAACDAVGVRGAR
jgi:hypothetical protein